MRRARIVKARSSAEPLSDRELQVLRLAAAGATNVEIAARLFITPGTVKNHLTSIMSKLGVRDRAQAGDPGGSIVVCGSLSIFQGRQGLEHYAAAKGALNAMVKGLAVEMGQYGVRANMIAPGFILTGMTDDNPQAEGMKKHFAAITPLKRPGYMADIQGPAAYLASDASSFHTGDVLVVDGGRTVNSQ